MPFVPFPDEVYNPNDPNYPGRRDAVVTQDEWLEVIDTLGGITSALGTNPAASTVTGEAYGTVDQRLEVIEGQIAVLARGALINLRIENNTVAPTTRLDLSWTALSIGGVLTENVTVTLNASNSQVANGRDASAALTAHTPYYVFAIYNPSTAVAASLLSASPTAPTLPTGYTLFRRVGSVVTASGSGTFQRFYQQDRRVTYLYDGNATRVVDGLNREITTVSLAYFVPLATRLARINCILHGGSTSDVIELRWRPTGLSFTTGVTFLEVSLANEEASSEITIVTDASAQVDIGQDQTTPSGVYHVVYVAGFEDPV